MIRARDGALLRSGTTAAVLVAVLALSLTACAGAASEPESSGSPDASGSPVAAGGIIALGHSGLTGENADPQRQGQEARDQSWATGDDPAVDSIYLRMAAADPVHEARAANAASAGAVSESLASQAEWALGEVPEPALAIIQTIDNDIHCDGSDAANVPLFGENLRAALETIAESSPDTAVLVVSQRGRPPMAADYFPIAAENPAPGDESCEFINAAGEYVPANADHLTAVIESYEAEQARVCGEFAQCSDDGGVNATFADTEADLAGGDGNHLTTAGQARTAELLWPVVAGILGY